MKHHISIFPLLVLENTMFTLISFRNRMNLAAYVHRAVWL